jgi:hypothetical protein
MINKLGKEGAEVKVLLTKRTDEGPFQHTSCFTY